MLTYSARHYIIYPELRNSSTGPAATGIAKRYTIMKNFKFSHFISRMALNGTSIAVYCNNNESIYRLVAERGQAKIRNSRIVDLTQEEYDSLPYDPYNLIDRFLHAAALCGV